MNTENRILTAQALGLVAIIAARFGIEIDAAAQADILAGLSAFGLVLTAVIAKMKKPIDVPLNKQAGIARVPFLGVLAAVVCGALMLAGCAAVKQNETAEKLVVQYAVMKVIEADNLAIPARAQRIHDIAADAQSFFDTGTSTLDGLRQTVAQRLVPLNLSPADQLLASALIETVFSELQSRVGAGIIPADQVYQIKTVLQWVIDATGFYAS